MLIAGLLSSVKIIHLSLSFEMASVVPSRDGIHCSVVDLFDILNDGVVFL
jgi:hypothetical protein